MQSLAQIVRGLFNMEEVKDKVALLQQQDLFINLVDDCQAIVLDIKQHGWAMILAYHNLGERLSRNKDAFLKQGYTMTELLEEVSNEVHRSRRTLYYAIKFYETYKDIQLVPYSEDAQWFQVVKDLTKSEKKQLLESTSADENLHKTQDKESPVLQEEAWDGKGEETDIKAHPPISDWVWEEGTGLWNLAITDKELDKVNAASVKIRMEFYLFNLTKSSY